MAEIKRQDVDSLAEKLTHFTEELPEQEKNVMDWIVNRASSTSTELSQEELDSIAGGGGLAASLGFSDDAESITVGWTLKF